MDLLFTEYDVAQNSHVLHVNFSIPGATTYSENSQASVTAPRSTLHNIFVVTGHSGNKETSNDACDVVKLCFEWRCVLCGRCRCFTLDP